MNAKKIISLLLVLITVAGLAACGKKNVEETVNPVENEEKVESPAENVEQPKEEQQQPKQEEEDKKEETKPSETKPSTPQKEPETAPESKPEASATTVGQKLLADFKSKAGSASDAMSLAESILANPVIAFSGATMAVEPGYLSGFGDTEITGFSEGVMFGPVIGSIPFVGYVFVLEDGVDASSFVSTLKSSADLRWNICVEADEMVAGSSGNKVFFVMCPKTFEE